MNDKSPVSNGETVNPNDPERKTAILKLQRAIIEVVAAVPLFPLIQCCLNRRCAKPMIDPIKDYGKLSIDRTACSTNTPFVEHAFERQTQPISIINLAFLIDTVRWNRS